MVIHDLVESKEYFAGETKADYYVIYERFENSNANFEKDGRFSLKESEESQEVVQILYGCDDYSLCCLEKYDVDDYPSLDAILQEVKTDHVEIFTQ